jgi:hypothetical protein
MYHYIVDSVDDQKICSSEFKDELGSRTVRETTDPVYGCMDETALNYDKSATIQGDSICEYPVIPPPPVFCSAHDTGQDLFQLYMLGTDPNHYGYFVENGVKMGVCQIVSYDGGFPNATAVRTGCECQMPDYFTWTTTGFTVYHIWEDCNGNHFYRDFQGNTVQPFGTFVFGQYCSILECPIK